MPATVTSRVTVNLNSILANTLGLAAGQAVIDTGLILALASGTGANQCDRVYSELDKPLAAAYDLDLSGALVDAFGAAMVMARVKAFIAIAPSTNTGNVIIGGDAAAVLLGFGAVAHTLTLRPGGAILIFAPDATGYPVVAATGDILQFAPSAGTQLCSFALLGCSV